MAEENKMQQMIRESLETIRTMVDANTVVGSPIETPAGTTIIPISKISVGYATGGLDSKKIEEKKTFAGGGGTGLSMQPVCFLAVHADGSVEMIALGGGGEQDTLDKIAGIIENAPGFLSKIKGLFSRKKKRSEAEADEEDIVDAVANAAAEAAAEVIAENED